MKTTTKFCIITTFCALLSFTGSLWAQFGEPKTIAKMVPEYEAIQPGQTFTVALELAHEPKWHSYFINDGIGISIIPDVEWMLPKGWKKGALQFPTPHQFSFAGAQVYGYEGTNYFLTTLTAPSDVVVGSTVAIEADSSWQVCDDKNCLPPRRKAFTLELRIAEQAEKNPQYSAVESYMLKKFPTKNIPSNWKFKAFEKNGRITLQVTPQLPEGTKFFEYDAQVDLQSERSIESKNGATLFVGSRNQGNELGGDPVESTGSLRGILYLPAKEANSEYQSFWVDVPLMEGTATAAR